MTPEDYNTSDLINSAQAYVNSAQAYINSVHINNTELNPDEEYSNFVADSISTTGSNLTLGSSGTITLSSNGSLTGNISNVSSPYVIQGSGTAPYTTTWTTTLSPDMNGDPPEKIAGVLKDLVEDYEGKLDECDKKLDEIVKEMKSKPESLQVLNSTFQYWVAFKYAYQGVIKKLQDYIKDYEETDN